MRERKKGDGRARSGTQKKFTQQLILPSIHSFDAIKCSLLSDVHVFVVDERQENNPPKTTPNHEHVFHILFTTMSPNHHFTHSISNVVHLFVVLFNQGTHG